MTIKIARPDVPQHFMVLRPISRKIIARRPDGTLLAQSTTAIRLIESGKTIYDPVIYFPKDAIVQPFTKLDKSTYCPLKGDASYYTAHGVEDLAWSYETPLNFASQIAGLIAFYADKVIMEEHPQ